MTHDEILAALNPEQASAAAQHTGPVLVLAGAGTGKTRVITFRIACMLADGIQPENILGLTFTNKAAREMRERLATLVDEKSAKAVTLGRYMEPLSGFLILWAWATISAVSIPTMILPYVENSSE